MSNPDEEYFGAQATDTYFRINADRARGLLAEKESTKAAARIAFSNAPDARTFLDAGCSSGHLLRSLMGVGLSISEYVGVDLDEPALESARSIWASEEGVRTSFMHSSVSSIPLEAKSVDVTISLNVLEHMRSLRPTLDELIRVTSSLLIMRTSVWDHTYIIQEVRNRAMWSGPNAAYMELPDPSEEVTAKGEPKAFVYQNMWGKQYLEAQINEICPEARILIQSDELFSPEALHQDTVATGLPSAAQVLNGSQVVGPLILPHCWVLVRLDEGSDPSLPIDTVEDLH